jgi:hypothetical protein
LGLEELRESQGILGEDVGAGLDLGDVKTCRGRRPIGRDEVGEVEGGVVEGFTYPLGEPTRESGNGAVGRQVDDSGATNRCGRSSSRNRADPGRSWKK